MMLPNNKIKIKNGMRDKLKAVNLIEISNFYIFQKRQQENLKRHFFLKPEDPYCFYQFFRV